jgi:hypothetical protein
MRPLPLFALALTCGLFLTPERADACFAPAHKVPKKVKPKKGQPPPVEVAPPNLMLGTTTAIISWDKRRQTTTLVPEVKGDLKKFSLLIPVAGRVSEKSIKVIKDEVHYQLLADTEPVLTVTRDEDPCGATKADAPASAAEALAPSPKKSSGAAKPSAADYGVKVEGHFEVGEYDLALLSAKNAKGLARWLRRFKYRVDDGVEAALGGYLDRGMKILVARVHLKKLLNEQFTSLRPLQIRSRNPGQPTIPLAIAAASGTAHDIIVLSLGPERMDLASHRMLELPSSLELPAFVADDWAAEYERIADNWLNKNGGRSAGLLEFAGPAPVMNVKSLGAKPGAFLTRWRMRVTPGSSDLVLAPARTAELYRASFTARIPWHGAPTCAAGRAYMRSLPRSFSDEAKAYAKVSGIPSAQTLESLRATYPKAFQPWKEPRREKKVAVVEAGAGEGAGGFMDSWWKIALGLFGVLVGLVVLGRVQRG